MCTAVVAGGFSAIYVGIINISRSEYITYKQVTKQMVDVSSSETSTSLSPTSTQSSAPIYYLQLVDGSIYFLRPNDFSPEQKPSQVYGCDTISLVYDAGNTQNIDATNDLNFTLGRPAEPTKGVGCHIVQITIGYDPQKALDNEKQSLTVYTANEYREHPKDYSRNNWISFTGGGLLLIGIVIMASIAIFTYKTTHS
ncbi:hypothetical protein [Ktedonospora formicarum]|uniref:Uncharacterized protein n=1 Tax=Ktedonospora formicarum TaxID=2778364 RepID=A0A8J3I7Z6_9CHLR|nr:hypothetical protein [Ktedonospora formicarum]GHO47478.1 hypothetical protein KSX_56410 [Ktedonospora formicarum]